MKLGQQLGLGLEQARIADLIVHSILIEDEVLVIFWPKTRL